MQRVLIANRGEIAVRITRTLQQMGLIACTVYSEADQDSLHTEVADEAYALGGTTSLESYLNQEKILQICKQHTIDAIHPGYGFLSENADFAYRCSQAGIIFIGPAPEVMRAMGDKLQAKATMIKAGVPVVPSFNPLPETDFSEFTRAASQIGYPVLVKAAAGGGGKGMRRVDHPQDLATSLQAATNEATKAFGDGRVFLEKYLDNPRHIEIQIFGDQHGNVVHLGERECSIQRRYQKVIEESPSPALSPQLRQKMGETACQAARALNYSNAGTMEFLLDNQGKYYFLEVNTRLQVEHPVTECVYGVDLVRAQVEVAQGQRLPFQQDQLTPRGWAIECRLYAEDPASDFLPCSGTVAIYEPPTGPGIRCDSGVKEGSRVSVHYDPMLAKLIACGHDREEARQRMIWALTHFPVLGLKHNLPYLRAIIEHPAFIAGETHTHFLQQHPINTVSPPIPESALVALAHHLQTGKPNPTSLTTGTNPFHELGAWRLQ